MSTQEPPQPPQQQPGPPPPPAPGEPAPQGPWASDYRSPPPLQGEPDPPPSLATAVKGMYVGAALSAIGILVSLTQRDAIRDQLEENDSSLTQDELDTAVNVGLAFSVIIGVIVVGLWIWMARSNERGHTWARTTATVLGALNILSLLGSLAMGQMTPVSAIVGVLSLILAAGILYLLYRPDSSEYYRARSR